MAVNKTTVKKLFNQLRLSINNNDVPEELESKLYWLLEERLDLSRTAILTDQEVLITQDIKEQLEEDVFKLNEGIPVQYILGKTWFYDLEFKVTPDVLIPRPETEELVHLIVAENKIRPVYILDIGTGSGCIPVSLKKGLPQASVWSLDVSEDALKIASENARLHKADVKFIHRSIFDQQQDLPLMDILVSNPPYVPEREKAGMQKEVLTYEPHLALFVKDDDPLIFYRRIAELGGEILNDEGKIYFEIHYQYGQQVMALLKELGYNNIQVIKDIHNKDRIVKATI